MKNLIKLHGKDLRSPIVAHVMLNKAKVLVLNMVSEVRSSSCVQIVNHSHFMSLTHRSIDNVAPEEPRSSSYKDAHCWQLEDGECVSV